jgi:hypothetical protein
MLNKAEYIVLKHDAESETLCESVGKTQTLVLEWQ